MVIADLPPNASLAELLSARARRTPLDRLAIDIAGGVLILIAASWAQPSGWVSISAAAACFVAYGCWAIADRRLMPLPWPEQLRHEGVWRAVQGASAVFGLGAFVLLLFSALGIALGTIIS